MTEQMRLRSIQIATVALLSGEPMKALSLFWMAGQ
jgi:hypothetical protein